MPIPYSSDGGKKDKTKKRDQESKFKFETHGINNETPLDKLDRSIEVSFVRQNRLKRNAKGINC